jgi:hypothetical protein
MSVYEWYVPGRVILGRISKESSPEEIKGDNARLMELLEQGQPPVHVIYDASRQGRMQVSLHELAGYLQFLKHPALGINCIYLPQPNRFLQMIIHGIGRPLGIHYYSADNYTALLAYLAEHDPSLDFESVPPLYPV